LLFFFSGRNGLESLAEMKWNQWPESNGMGGRDRLEFAFNGHSYLLWKNPRCSAA